MISGKMQIRSQSFKQIMLMTVLVFSAASLYANEKKIQAIRDIYQNIQKAELLTHTIHCNYVLPALGPRRTAIIFHHSSKQLDPEKDPYDLKYYVRKITVEYTVAALSVYIEYVYDSNEQPVFYYKRETYSNGAKNETRYYFNPGKLFMIITDNMDTKQTTTDRFSLEQRKQWQAILKNSQKYKILFAEVVKAGSLE